MDRITDFQDQVSVTIENDGILNSDSDSDSDSKSAVSSNRRFRFFSSNDRLMVKRLEEGTGDYEVLKRSFVGGMRDYGRNIDVVGIHKRNYGMRIMDEARLEAFKVFANAVATSSNGGGANIKYGWYGGSADEIQEVLSYGFRRFENRPMSYGRGVYLSPANLPMESAKSSVADSDGLRYVLLCRVILGKPEEICFGSQNDRPSSMEFNSGVDNLSSPKKYIIWEPYMNTHIIPAFIVTFKADSLTGVGSLRTPTSPHMSINGLMRHLKNYLSSSKMMLLKRHHHEYLKNNISRSGFIRNLRAIAGDDLLRTIVQGLR